MSKRDKRFLQLLGLIEVLRHWDALQADCKKSIPDIAVEDTEYAISFCKTPDPYLYGSQTPASRRENFADFPIEMEYPEVSHVQNIVEDRRKSGISLTVIKVMHSSWEHSSSATAFCVVEGLEQHAVQQRSFSPGAGAKRPSGTSAKTVPFACRYDDVDELVRLVKIDAQRTNRRSWDNDIVQAAVQKYLKEAGGAMKLPIFY